MKNIVAIGSVAAQRTPAPRACKAGGASTYNGARPQPRHWPTDRMNHLPRSTPLPCAASHA
jgi:hypothetical protein